MEVTPEGDTLFDRDTVPDTDIVEVTVAECDGDGETLSVLDPVVDGHAVAVPVLLIVDEEEVLTETDSDEVPVATLDEVAEVDIEAESDRTDEKLGLEVIDFEVFGVNELEGEGVFVLEKSEVTETDDDTETVALLDEQLVPDADVVNVADDEEVFDAMLVAEVEAQIEAEEDGEREVPADRDEEVDTDTDLV